MGARLLLKRRQFQWITRLTLPLAQAAVQIAGHSRVLGIREGIVPLRRVRPEIIQLMLAAGVDV